MQSGRLEERKQFADSQRRADLYACSHIFVDKRIHGSRFTSDCIYAGKDYRLHPRLCFANLKLVTWSNLAGPTNCSLLLVAEGHLQSGRQEQSDLEAQPWHENSG